MGVGVGAREGVGVEVGVGDKEGALVELEVVGLGVDGHEGFWRLPEDEVCGL